MLLVVVINIRDAAPFPSSAAQRLFHSHPF